ncbi:MAG: ribonuclease E/G [Pseudomonadota bacterium]
MEEVPQRRRKRRREYKIQEVIKRRQIILVQVVKEERGNKGAALTTYLSMAGRYCVLMPNTSRGGGISRKITDAQDRKRLKEVAGNLEIPQGMGLIVRTAGANRTKAEIKRDCDYLMRLWENVRDLTLKSHAPSLVYEEGSLIKRSIRDLYGKDVDGIVVEGEPAYREAKDLMKMLMPSHAKNVKPHKDSRPLFSRNQIESQLDALYSPQVTLPSGGYIVINQTEALVAVDVNSGKSTREHNIENTALNTNLEAAEEVARQMRLRDLAGLIVLDFIDMEERRNNRSVERKLKDVLKNDRARIQVGRISHFGLLEMSRQRMRTGVLEGSTQICPHCEGQGFIRSTESCALSVLRGAEEHLMGRKSPDNIIVRCDGAIAAYILNQKRDHLHALESTFEVVIFVEASGEFRGSDYKIEKSEGPSRRPARHAAVSLTTAYEEDGDDAVEEAEDAIAADEDADRDDDDRPRRKRRRRGRRGGRGRGRDEADGDAPREASGESEGESDGEEAGDDQEGGRKRGRRRRSRGSRRRGRGGQQSEQSARSDEAGPDQATQDIPGTGDQPDVPLGDLEDPWDTTPQKEDRAAETDESAPPAAAPAEAADPVSADKAAPDEPAPKPKAKRKSRAKKKAAAVQAEDSPPAEEADTAEAGDAEPEAAVEAKPARKKRAPRKKKAAAKAKAAPEGVTDDAAPDGEAATNGSGAGEKGAEPDTPEPAVEAEPVQAAPEPPEDAAPPPPPEPDRPKRRGWWQRR